MQDERQLLLARLAYHRQITHANIASFFCSLGLVLLTRLCTLTRFALRFHCSGDGNLVTDMLREINAFAAQTIGFPVRGERVLVGFVTFLQASRNRLRLVAPCAGLLSLFWRLGRHGAPGCTSECERKR